ncbi:hypothetical protein GWI33_004977 [Rhynchophorus ferrugineus]|uniref:Uncharacterized protein n=1 Tax=Rhynchophorus ferrugineus TaxID=354439 RepID=A0A834IP74_RHYFE|nr:hypothetical protein GWI33_004977 [Rhynchophorus ferrugineus]
MVRISSRGHFATTDIRIVIFPPRLLHPFTLMQSFCCNFFAAKVEFPPENFICKLNICDDDDVCESDYCRIYWAHGEKPSLAKSTVKYFVLEKFRPEEVRVEFQLVLDTFPFWIF